MSDDDSEYKKYVNDSRIECKYGAKCYQKNPQHHQKYKHPPKRKTGNSSIQNKHVAKKCKAETADDVKEIVTKQDDSDSDYNIYDDSDSNNSSKEHSARKKNNDVSDTESSDKQTSDSEDETQEDDMNQSSGKEIRQDNKEIEKKSDSNTHTNTQKVVGVEAKDTSAEANKEYSNSAKFIKEKFLVQMPPDFYQFWNFCKKLNLGNPSYALKDVGLILVGPFDVLAEKFKNASKKEDEYLIHWRYYRDPPEFQTVLKGNDKTGYHIGYFRDSPEDLPVFVCSNQSKKDGILMQMGENLFAAVNFYLEDLKKSGDPFQKMHVGRIQSALNNEAQRLKINMSRKTMTMVAREKNILARTLNKIGLVVPYNKSTQIGYRELAMGNKDITILLTKLQNAKTEEKSQYLSALQPVFTFANIATDECDFGTGIELGWDLISHGIDNLNMTISDFLTTNYRLTNREAFAKIAEAHMKQRRQGTNLSIL